MASIPKRVEDRLVAGTHAQLFSSSFAERFEATRLCGESPGQKEVEFFPPWPFGNHGAANAWLVLVGPSPGGGAPRSEPQRRRVGSKFGFLGFHEKPARNRIWFELVHAGFGKLGEPIHRERLSAVFNLVSGNQSVASKLDPTALQNSTAPCLNRILECCPRVVVALTKNVFGLLRSAAETRIDGQVAEFVGPASLYSKAKAPLDAFVFSWTNPFGNMETLFLRAPSHPSRPQRLNDGTNSMTAEGASKRYSIVRETVAAFEATHPQSRCH